MAERPKTRAAGFTLIEILAVVVIIGIVTGIAVISISALGGRSAQAQVATRLAGRIELASENARMENIQYGLKIKPHHYEFLVFNGRGNWLPLTNKPVLAARGVPKGMKLSVHVENAITLPVVSTAIGAADADSSGLAEQATPASSALTPQIAILSTGEITPFTLRLTASGGKTWVVRGNASGRVHVVPPASVNGPNAIHYRN
ncbi:MAG: type II secretion system minor pseudopilin GspH [Gammaproteobacteria bacterium]